MAVQPMQGLDTLYKPWGMTAGGMVGRRETDMEAADLINLEEGMLGNVLKQVEASRAANDFSDPRMEMLRQQGIMGDNMSKSAQGQMAMGTLDTGIGAKNAANRAAQSGSEIDSMINSMDQSLAMIQANGPAGMAMVMQGMPPQLRQIMEQAGPQAPQVLMKLSEMLKQQRSVTPTHIGSMALEDRKNANNKTANAAQETQRQTNRMEQARFEAGAAAARQREHDANLKAIEQSRRSDAEKIQSLEQLATSYLKAAEESTDPADRDSYMKSYEKAYNALMGVKTAASSAKSLGDVNAVRALRGLPPLTQEQYDQQQKQEGSTRTTGGWGATEIKATR